MDNHTAPDPVAAAQHLQRAKTSILEAVRALHNPRKAAGLSHIAKQLGVMAVEFEARRMMGGLNVPLVDRKLAARAMGQVSSDKKSLGAAEARRVLAEKRATEKEVLRILMTVAKHTMGLNRKR